MTEDRPLYQDIAAVCELVDTGALRAAVEHVVTSLG
jgi:hypothetical protein